MIPNQWYPILRCKQLGAKKPLGVRRLGRDLVLWRDAVGAVCCGLDRCAHRFARLSKGRVREGRIECPYHGIRYERSGRAVLIPSDGPDKQPAPGMCIPTYPTRESRDLIWMWYGPGEPTENLPWDETIDEELSADEAVTYESDGVFPVNYLRIMENATDIPHVAFVHRQAFAKYTRLEDFTCTREGHIIRVAGRLRPEGEDKGQGFVGRGLVIAPNMLVLHLADGLCFLAAATPIDEERTWLFARYYNSWLTVPGLGYLVSFFMFWVDFWLLQKYQDLPVWNGQSRSLPDPGRIGGYCPVKADKGVLHYFRMRRELIEEVHPPAEGDHARGRGIPDLSFGHYGDPEE